MERQTSIWQSRLGCELCYERGTPREEGWGCRSPSLSRSKAQIDQVQGHSAERAELAEVGAVGRTQHHVVLGCRRAAFGHSLTSGPIPRSGLERIDSESHTVTSTTLHV